MWDLGTNLITHSFWHWYLATDIQLTHIIETSCYNLEPERAEGSVNDLLHMTLPLYLNLSNPYPLIMCNHKFVWVRMVEFEVIS